MKTILLLQVTMLITAVFGLFILCSSLYDAFNGVEFVIWVGPGIFGALLFLSSCLFYHSFKIKIPKQNEQ